MAASTLRSMTIRLAQRRVFLSSMHVVERFSFANQQRTFASEGAGAVDGKDYLLGNGPNSMRASVFWEPHKPMTIEDLQMPRPQAGEVLVKTKACGVCHSDLHVINADQPYPLPVVLGHEITGEVVEHGQHTDQATRKRSVGLGN